MLQREMMSNYIKASSEMMDSLIAVRLIVLQIYSKTTCCQNEEIIVRFYSVSGQLLQSLNTNEVMLNVNSDIFEQGIIFSIHGRMIQDPVREWFPFRIKKRHRAVNQNPGKWSLAQFEFYLSEERIHNLCIERGF